MLSDLGSGPSRSFLVVLIAWPPGTQCGGMVGETGCEHVFLLTWLLKKHRIPRFGAQPFGFSVRLARGTRLASLPPSFLSSSPAMKGSARTGAVKEPSARLVRPAAKRGHGLARLDGTRPRATVADKVMDSGKTAGHGNGRPCVPNRTASEARRPEAGSRAGGVSRPAGGNDGSPDGARLAQRGSMRYAHDSAPGHLPGAGGRFRK